MTGSIQLRINTLVQTFPAEITNFALQFCTFYTRKALSCLMLLLQPPPACSAARAEAQTQHSSSRITGMWFQEEAHGRSEHLVNPKPGKGGIYNTWKTEVLKAQHSCYQTRDQQLLILGKPIAPFLQENLDKTGRNRRKTGQMKIAWAL